MLVITANIHYVTGKEDLLDSVADLWNELNQLHQERSPYYQELYADYTFTTRKGTLLATAQKGRLQLFLAYDGSLLVGYCIASVVDDTGEIDSLFVTEQYRKKGLASQLMEQALAWLQLQNPMHMVIKVSVGNEAVFGFYAKYGFYPQLTELRPRSDQ